MIEHTTHLENSNTERINRKTKLIQCSLLFAVILLICKPTIAQTRSVNFEAGTWEEIKSRAGRENKLIFLDGFATWCGICKRMDKDVFTNDSVAGYFNSTFVNAKINMESGEGIAIAKQYNVTAYPTLLFIDAQGNMVHRTVGGLQPDQLLEFGRQAQNAEGKMAAADDVGSTTQTSSNKTEIGFNVSQYQRDFGVGLHVITPYFFRQSVAIKAGTNIQWFENFNGAETVFSTYQNIQLGMRGRSVIVNHNISVYGEGGAFLILPGSDFSSQTTVLGGYGLFGFEFRIIEKFAYFIELGGVGTGATADKIINKPIYSNGFLTNVGLKIGL